MLERVLSQFRQVARPGCRLAISVSLTGAHGEARSRFQASVATLGEPARSSLDADAVTELLARTGWHVMASGDADDSDAAARRERLRLAGLLTASAVPTTSAGPTPSTALSTRRPPRKPHQTEQPQGPLSRPPGCPRRSSRSRSSHNEAETPPPAPHHHLRRRRPGRRGLAGVAGHVRELPAVRH